MNAAIRPLLDRLNDKVSRHLGASRRQLFEQLDKPALKPLPVAPYVFAEWKKCRAGLDYHIAIDKPRGLQKRSLTFLLTPNSACSPVRNGFVGALGRWQDLPRGSDVGGLLDGCRDTAGCPCRCDNTWIDRVDQ